MASADPSRLIAQLVTMTQGNPQRDEMWPCLANAANTTVSAREREIKADLSDKDKYLAFFAGVSEYPIFPHVRRPRILT